MPTASTPGKRAMYRVQRAVKAGTQPVQRDLLLMQEEGLEMEGISFPSLQSSSQPTVQLLQPSQSDQVILPTSPAIQFHPKSENAQSSREDGVRLEDRLPQRKPVGQIEKDYYDYFAYRFGPWVVLILWLCTASLEKATFYAPTPEECRGIALPAAKLAKRIEDLVHVPKWVHTVVTSSDDITTTGMVIVGYLDRIGVLEKLVPYYMGLANRMGAVNAKYRNPINKEKADVSTNNGSVPPPPGYDAAAFFGIGGQHSPN